MTDVELGNRTPKTDTVERLAMALKVEPCWLAYGDGRAPEGWRKEVNEETEHPPH